MCSRGRPLQLVAALTSLRDNESGKHEVRYAVACDVDDKATIGTLVSLQAKLPLGYRVGHRPVSLDALHNQLALDMPADVYACFIDDALCLTKDWDDRIAEVYEANPKGLWWWRSKGPDLTLMPITSEAWRQAAGRIFPEHFPYWWGDTWLSEVFVLATERNLDFAPVEFLDCPKKTHNMRELRFWHNYYLFLQPERIAEARKIAAGLGLPAPTITGPLAQVIGTPNQDFVKRIDEIEKMQGDPGEPHEGYRIAKERAVAKLMEPGGMPIAPPVTLQDLMTPELLATLRAHYPALTVPA
jgi:hypothetical protein